MIFKNEKRANFVKKKVKDACLWHCSVHGLDTFYLLVPLLRLFSKFLTKAYNVKVKHYERLHLM